MKVEIRSANEAFISGYVNVVERDSRILPRIMCNKTSGIKSFVEKVKAKVFEKALRRADKIELRFNHQNVIGDSKNNLVLYEDNIGLRAEATITDPDIVEKAKKGELRGWSFGFRAIGEEWENIDDNTERRILTDIDLREVSILDKTPAYIATSIETRGEEDVVYELRGVEDVSQVTDKATTEPIKIENLINNRCLIQRLEFLKLKGELQ